MDNNEQPVGKQWRWYTTCSGIWQTVYVEPRGASYIDSWTVRTDIEKSTAAFRIETKNAPTNSAIEIDITGQVCADSIGTYQYSGIGGQMDFIRGASLSEDGKPIIAMPSTTSKGLSRIVPFLKEGAGVVTTRGHVHWVVTEHGIVNLFGLNLKQRAKALISIAHPEHREFLNRAFHDRYK